MIIPPWFCFLIYLWPFLGRFCFCGDALPDNSLIDSSKCTDKCSGDVLQDCGSKDYVSVFTAAPPILGLTLASDAGSNVVQIGNEVTFSASISSGGANLAFKMDYDDGAGKTDQNATNLWKRTYNTPGHYRVSVYGNDQMESLMVCNKAFILNNICNFHCIRNFGRMKFIKCCFRLNCFDSISSKSDHVS